MPDFLSKNLTLIKALYSQHFENQAIVLCKTTNEYFPYLLAPWDCSHQKSVRHKLMPLPSTNATDPI